MGAGVRRPSCTVLGETSSFADGWGPWRSEADSDFFRVGYSSVERGDSFFRTLLVDREELVMSCVLPLLDIKIDCSRLKREKGQATSTKRWRFYPRLIFVNITAFLLQ